MQHQIVFLDRESVGANVRKPEFPHSYKEYEATWTPEEILERLKDATIAIINKVPMRGDTLKKLPKLKLIAVAATGTDVVDKAFCKENGITVVNIRNYAFNTVPEHVLALISRFAAICLPMSRTCAPDGGARSTSSVSSTIRSATSPARRSA